ncbi:putative ribonuclease H protein [Corchorus olitorius]|uniref:Ribonuclease H protein n=1 Tax=Corchorus olitorius TaxID=93759 RepID=A0A1R3JLZ4_9ROSI|nr:putative ribonuclease H protein [Corchorus olitorius]
MHLVDPIGFADGLWMLWNHEEVNVNILRHGDQSIHAEIQLLENKETPWVQSVSFTHDLRNYKQAASVWRALKPPDAVHQSFQQSLSEWFKGNAKYTKPAQHTIPWNIIFSFTIWEIWKLRIAFCFGKTVSSTDRVVANILQKAAEFFATSEAPGGIIRDYQGNFILGFQRILGITTSTVAELWAIREGLLLAKSRNILNIIMESNSQLDLLLNCFDEKHNLIVLLDNRRCILDHSSAQELRHTFGEGGTSVLIN